MQPVILLRTLQRELLTLLELTKPQLRNPSLNTSLPTQTLKADFDRLKIWQSRRPLYTAAIQRLTYQKLFEDVYKRQIHGWDIAIASFT